MIELVLMEMEVMILMIETTEEKSKELLFLQGIFLLLNLSSIEMESMKNQVDIPVQKDPPIKVDVERVNHMKELIIENQFTTLLIWNI